MTLRRSTVPLVLTAAATLLSLACTSNHHSGVATAGGAASTSTASDSFDQDFVNFAHCMREHGIDDFPDPVQRPGHDGLSLQFPEGFDASDGPGKVANDACEHFIQPVIDMKRRNVIAQLTPE